jgi:sec-independent protein translocase protein TatA
MTHLAANPHILAIFDVGGGEMILIFVVVLLLFGGKRMPELARGLGKSLSEFKKATSGVEAQIKQAMDDVRETTVTPVRKTIVSAMEPVTEESLLSEPASPAVTKPVTPPPSTGASSAQPEDTR